MYVVADRPQLGQKKKTPLPTSSRTPLDHYFDVRRCHQHPTNDDQALANQALIEGDAVLMQRLWAQQKRHPMRLNQPARAAPTPNSSAPLSREQLLPRTAMASTSCARCSGPGGYPGVDEVFRNRPIRPSKSTPTIRAHEKPVDVSLPDADGRLGPGYARSSRACSASWTCG
jgi:hypothetical protein